MTEKNFLFLIQQKKECFKKVTFSTASLGEAITDETK